MEALIPNLPPAAWSGVAGKRVLITGGTSGIGLAASTELVRRGALLTLVARTESRAAEAVRAIDRGSPKPVAVDVLFADLSSQASVRRLAEQALAKYPRIQVLINNAGAIYRRRQLSPDGIELTWAVNHLAPFLLTTLLLDRLKASAPARIITTSSDAHKGARIPFDDLAGERSWSGMGFGRYGETKLANILFTVELAARLSGTGVTANSFHPGFVATGFNRNNGPVMRVGMALSRPFARSPQKGAETLVWLADAEAAGRINGAYVYDMRAITPAPAAQDREAARRLWELSEQQTRVRA
ncbi:MAG TPA: SDR family oxidoreductase [Candidatus Dormibacteraeota bacterium]|jgi:NAD(P)-dependent dehydrogenase (short-subunit alcohol dehydrogenase family)|nr:SDR family oxidoreductase [Candidatus Dormibacteraeota bacterium]